MTSESPQKPNAEVPQRSINIVWLDDNLHLRPKWFEPLRVFMQKTHQQVKLIEITSIENYATLLKKRASLTVLDPDYIDWIWLDVLLQAQEEGETFIDLGFEDVEQFDYMAGAQVMGLMKNPIRTRPSWLEAYKQRPITLYTSINNIGENVGDYVAKSVLDNKEIHEIFVKSFQYGSNMVLPEARFIAHVEQRLTWCASQFQAALQTLQTGGDTND